MDLTRLQTNLKKSTRRFRGGIGRGRFTPRQPVCLIKLNKNRIILEIIIRIFIFNN